MQSKADSPDDLVKRFKNLSIGKKVQAHSNTLNELDATGLLTLLNEMNKGEQLLLTTETKIPLRKSGKVKTHSFDNPWEGDEVWKRSVVGTYAKPDYKEALTSFAKVGEEVKVKPRKWGKRLIGTPYVLHQAKGRTEVRMYLEVRVVKTYGHEYFLKGTGELIEMKVLEPFLSKTTTASRPAVIWRDYDIRHITLVQARGKTYRISQNFQIPLEQRDVLSGP